MPFTVSHIAAVVPLTGRRFWSVSGLLAGSMVPDFEYFLRLKVYGIYGHTFAGMFWFDLPLAIVLVYFFHHLVKPVFSPILPGGLRRRWMRYSGLNWHSFFMQNTMAVILSVLVGCGTHILWDAFTHNNTFIVRAWPLLRTQVDLGFQDYPLWHILQQVSTVIGLIIVLYLAYRLPAESAPPGKFKTMPWAITALLTAGIMGWRLYDIAADEIVKIGHVAVIGIGAFMYSILLVSVVSMVIKKVRTA